MDRWIAFDPLYTLSLTLFLSLYQWKFSNTQHHLVVKEGVRIAQVVLNLIRRVCLHHLVSIYNFYAIGGAGNVRKFACRTRNHSGSNECCEKAVNGAKRQWAIRIPTLFNVGSDKGFCAVLILSRLCALPALSDIIIIPRPEWASSTRVICHFGIFGLEN